MNPVVVGNGSTACILIPLATPKRLLGAILVLCPLSPTLTPELSLLLQEISLLSAPGFERVKQVSDEVKLWLEQPQHEDLKHMGTIYDDVHE